MIYDAANELTSVTYSDGTTPNVTNITYDLDGQRTAMTDGTGTSSWSYDSLQRLTSYSNGHGTTVGYSYNLRGLPITITYPGGHALTQGYDDAGRLTSVQDWLATPNTTTFGYDADGNVTRDNLPNGVVDSYTFNTADQLTSISDMKGTTTIFSTTYTRDKNAQLTSDSSQSTSQGSYKYTALNQLCYAASKSTKACSKPPANSYPYAYDAADNLTTTENAAHSGTNRQAFNAADQLISAGSSTTTACDASPPSGTTSFCFDTRGNRTSAVPNSGPATCNTYNQADQLTSIQTGTGPSCTGPTNVGTYGYDGTGLRMSKTIGGTTTQFTWDESGGLPMLLQEKAGAANPTSYIYGPGGLPVEQIDPSGNPHFYAHDQLGSTRALTDTSGTLQATYRYDPYGNVVSESGTIVNPLQFAGQYADNESGLYYLRARYYEPSTTQFLSADSAVSSTMSPYAYVAGNPLDAADPTGLWPDLNPVDWGRAAVSGTTSAWNATGGQVVNAVQNGGLPGGNCIVLIQNNCQENLVGNVQTIENSPVGPLLRADPFVASAFDLAKARSGQNVGTGQGLLDIVGMALVFSPGQFFGSIPSRIAGPLADDWSLAASLWNNRFWIGRGIMAGKNYAWDAMKSCLQN